MGEATGSKIATMHERYYVEAGGLNLKLKTMEMLPYFFAPLSSIIGFRHINASRTVDSLLALTEICQLGVSIKGLNPILRRMWLEGAATKLILAAVETHMDSLCGYGDKTRDREMPLGMESSWSGIHIAAELYLHQVLRLWNVGGLLEVNFHLHILAYLSWDLAKSEGVLDAGPIATSKLWFWKAFVGAFSLARHMKVNHQQVLDSLKSEFLQHLSNWSRATGVNRWEEARGALVDIAWPGSAFADDALAERTWHQSQLIIRG